MSEAFLKAVKWLVLVECVVVGSAGFIISNATGSIAPIMIGILAYGVVYVMSFFWKEFRDKLLLISIILFLVLSYASNYVPEMLYVAFGWPMEGYNEFYLWGTTVGIIGVPFMTLAFYKYD